MKRISFILILAALLMGSNKMPDKYKSFDETMSVINEYTKKKLSKKRIFEDLVMD